MSRRTDSSEKSVFLMGWMNELTMQSLPGKDDTLRAGKPGRQTSKQPVKVDGSRVQRGCGVEVTGKTTTTTATTQPVPTYCCYCRISDDGVVSKDIFAHPPTKTDDKNTNFGHPSPTCRHSKEKEELVSRNIQLEKQLQEARRTIRAHEERLLIYSQMINSHSLALNQNLAGCPARPPMGRNQPDAVSMKNYYNRNKCSRQARAMDSLTSNSTVNSFNDSNYSEYIVVPR